MTKLLLIPYFLTLISLKHLRVLCLKLLDLILKLLNLSPFQTFSILLTYKPSLNLLKLHLIPLIDNIILPLQSLLNLILNPLLYCCHLEWRILWNIEEDVSELSLFSDPQLRRSLQGMVCRKLRSQIFWVLWRYKMRFNLWSAHFDKEIFTGY